MNNADPSTEFYAALPSFAEFDDFAEFDAYASVPDDWVVLCGDIRGSTRAIEEGRYRQVNMVGAAVITAVLNACAGYEIPFVFGGDGGLAVVPGPARDRVHPGELPFAAGEVDGCADLRPVHPRGVRRVDHQLGLVVGAVGLLDQRPGEVEERLAALQMLLGGQGHGEKKRRSDEATKGEEKSQESTGRRHHGIMASREKGRDEGRGKREERRGKREERPRGPPFIDHRASFLFFSALVPRIDGDVDERT